MTLHFNKTNYEYNTKAWNKQYQTNLKFWGMLKNDTELNEAFIHLMINQNADFWINIENLNPYKANNKIMISVSLSYIGTNKFYGYIGKEYYNSLIESQF